MDADKGSASVTAKDAEQKRGGVRKTVANGLDLPVGSLVLPSLWKNRWFLRNLERKLLGWRLKLKLMLNGNLVSGVSCIDEKERERRWCREPGGGEKGGSLMEEATNQTSSFWDIAA